MSDTHSIGPAFTPEEDAYFESGDAGTIPAESGAPAGADGDGAAPPLVPEKEPAAAPKMVALEALHEERTKRQARDTENRKLALENAELKGKFSIIERLNMAPGEPGADAGPKVAPKVEDDIFGAVNAQGETVAQIQKRLDDADAATAATNERNTFVNNYKADAAKFEATKPDYRPAYDFILASRAAELQAIGYDTPEALHNALTADEFAIAEMAFSKGKSPAEMLYALAVQRGYKPPAAGAGDAKPGAGAEKLEAIERGQNANKSLSNLGGEAPGGEMTAAALIAMPMPQFEKWCEDNPAKAKRLMGG